MSINPLTLPDRITVYHCFYGGITLLQCLSIKPTALSPRRAHQAISACLSALAVYTRVLPAVAPFLRLFEDVSKLFVCNDRGADVHPCPKVRDLLNRIISSDPSETSEYVWNVEVVQCNILIVVLQDFQLLLSRPSSLVAFITRAGGGGGNGMKIPSERLQRHPANKTSFPGNPIRFYSRWPIFRGTSRDASRHIPLIRTRRRNHGPMDRTMAGSVIRIYITLDHVGRPSLRGDSQILR